MMMQLRPVLQTRHRWNAKSKGFLYVHARALASCFASADVVQLRFRGHAAAMVQGRAMTGRAPQSTSGVVIESFGKLAMREKTLPELASSHIVVEVVGAAVNPADTYMCQGTYTLLPPLPFTPGLEASGRVLSVGADVKHLDIGDPVVFAITAADGGIAASTGSWARHCMVRASLATRIPHGLDLVSAAAIPIAYLTAHRALFHVANSKPTDRILVRGASGAVGLAAIHLAKHFGSADRVLLGTASSTSGQAAVQSRGGMSSGHADDDVRNAVSDASFDVILDLMANENLGSDLQLVAPNGRIVVIGSRPGAGLAQVDARQALVKEAIVRGVFLWRQTENERKAAYEDIFSAFGGADQAAPTIRCFHFHDALQAHDIVAAQAQGKAKTEGKVILVPGLETAQASGACRSATKASRAAALKAAASAKVIDVHAHAVLEETSGAAGKYGPEVGETDGKPWYRIGDYFLRNVQYRGSPFMDPAVRIARMEQDGIDLQVLSPNPLTYFHHIPAEEALNFCQRHNDALADVVSNYPHRLVGLAALPMQCPELAARELTRSVQELGLLGAGVGTDFGMAVDDERLDAFYSTCCQLDVPLFMHPAPKGIDGPHGDERLRRFELDIVIGFNLDSAVTIATLVFGGVLDRHQKLDICFPSGGGALASLIGRMSRAAAAPRPWVPEDLRSEDTIRDCFQRLWFDTHMHDDGALRLLIEHCGDKRLVFGTNFAGWDQDQGANPPNLDNIDVLGNARRLLRLA